MLLSDATSKRYIPVIKLVYILAVALCTLLIYSSVIMAYYLYNIVSINQQIEDAALNSPDILNPPTPDLHGFCEDFAKFRERFPASFVLGSPMSGLYSVAPICSKAHDSIPYTVTFKD